MPKNCSVLRRANTSSDDADASKPDADIFQVAMDRFGLDPAQTVAIGDTTWDAKAAARAGIAFVGVETGGTERRQLLDEGAVAVHADAADLAQAVAERGRVYFAR